MEKISTHSKEKCSVTTWLFCLVLFGDIFLMTDFIVLKKLNILPHISFCLSDSPCKDQDENLQFSLCGTGLEFLFFLTKPSIQHQHHF